MSVEHFRDLLRIVVPHFSRYVDLPLEFNDITLLEVTLEDIAFADPATLRVMTVVIISHDFRHFVPTSLGSFRFGVVKRPLESLSSLSGGLPSGLLMYASQLFHI
jgi:hypothetical protein